MLILLSILSQSLALVFMKLAALELMQFTLLKFITNKFIWIAVFCLLLQSILWQLVLRKHNLSYAYYFMSLRYFITLCFGYFLFHEQVNFIHLVGLVIIAYGITIFAKGKAVV
jgi:drug/metabolite transporter (DMT)-like permease